SNFDCCDFGFVYGIACLKTALGLNTDSSETPVSVQMADYTFFCRFNTFSGRRENNSYKPKAINAKNSVSNSSHCSYRTDL
ncbi:hypothetical protein WAJ07_21310, partial [Acinetobacter baumannii]